MSEFIVTASVRINAQSAEHARNQAESAIRAGREAGYYLVDGEVTSVDAYVAPRTYTQAEYDAAVAAARAGQ